MAAEQSLTTEQPPQTPRLELAPNEGEQSDHRGGIADFLDNMMAAYKDTKQAVSTNAADQHLNNPDYTPHYNQNGELESVTGKDGKPVRTFSDYQNGKPMHIGMDDGSAYVSRDGGKTYTREYPDATAPFLGTNLTVDKRGNISFDSMLSRDGRVTVCADNATIVTPDSRADWMERSKGATVKKSDDGRTMEVLDKDGVPIRTIKFDAEGKPQSVTDSDGESWETKDGGHTWTHTWANGGGFYYHDCNLRVDSRGNITYDRPGGDTATEQIDGRVVSVYKK